MSSCIDDGLLIQYADDTQILLSDSFSNLGQLIYKAQLTLSKIKNYFLTNGLLINENKTQCIFIGTHQYIHRIPENINIGCEGENISPSHHVKNLGLHMDRFMTFDKHIDELCKKVMGVLMYINRLKNSFDKSTRIQVVESLALSTMNYCLLIWGTTSSRQLEKAQKLQNFAARVADGRTRKFDHVSPLIKELGWLKIKEKNLYDTYLTVFKIM